MKVLHLLQSDVFNGAENVVCQIIAMFQNDPDMETVYCSRDGKIRKVLEERNIRFAPVKAFTSAEIKKVIQAEKPDVIHAHDMRASFYAAQVCGSAKLISHVHNNNFDSRGFSLKSLAYLYAGFRASHIFWVSQSSFEGYAFHKFLKKKSTVLYNVIDVNALYEKMEQDSNAYDYDVIYVGRQTYQKNPERLIAVMEKLVQKRPETQCAVVGTGDLSETVKKIVEDRHLGGNIHLLGYQSNPVKMMHDAKVMLMTSRWEGTPMCALEAMSLGLPIISTPADGLMDLVENDVTGFLSDEDETLAEKLSEVLENSEYRTTLSQNSRDKAMRLMDLHSYRRAIIEAYEG